MVTATRPKMVATVLKCLLMEKIFSWEKIFEWAVVGVVGNLKNSEWLTAGLVLMMDSRKVRASWEGAAVSMPFSSYRISVPFATLRPNNPCLGGEPPLSRRLFWIRLSGQLPTRDCHLTVSQPSNRIHLRKSSGSVSGKRTMSFPNYTLLDQMNARTTYRPSWVQLSWQENNRRIYRRGRHGESSGIWDINVAISVWSGLTIYLWDQGCCSNH
jgi:hypothetical protein